MWIKSARRPQYFVHDIDDLDYNGIHQQVTHISSKFVFRGATLETRASIELQKRKTSKFPGKFSLQKGVTAVLTALLLQNVACPRVVLAQSVPLPPAQADLPSSSSAGDTVVNNGETHVFDFSNSSSISVLNNLMNMGTIYALSSNPAITSGSINANNVFNFPGAIITSVLPAGGLAGYSNAISGFSFSLNAANNIVNSGAITSAGDLNLIAGGAVINALPATVTGPSPVMQAMQNVNVISSNLLNSGIITSALANINVSTVLAQNVMINNQFGVLQALNGSLNIRDSLFTEKFNTTIFGGDILAKELNLFSGSGITDISVLSLTPKVNLDTGEAYVKANSNISIGTIIFNGDPTFTSGGDVFLEGDQDGNGPLTVEATGDIINKSALHVEGTGPIRYHAGGSILLDGLKSIITNDKIELLADGGSVLAPGTSIEAGLRVAGLPPGPVPGNALPSSVFVFAHENIDIGNVKSPDGSVLLRAGGDKVGNTYFAGSNPASLNAGSIDISGERVSGPGQIWIDNFGGNITLGSLIGDGGRLLVQSGGDLQIVASDGAKAAIQNNALAVRSSNFFTAETILQANQINISGGDIESSGGALQLQSSGDIQLSQVAHITANDLFNNGAFVRINGSGSVVFDQSPIFSLLNTNPTPTELQIISEFGTLSFGSPLEVSANGTAGGASGGNVLLGGAAISFAGKVSLSANGQGSGSGGGINIAAGNALTFSKADILLTASGGTDGGGGGFVGVAGSGLQIDARSIDVNAGVNGNGGWIRLDGSNAEEVGTQLIITGGALQADGNGTGNGGTVQLINGQSAFVLGGKGANATGVNVRSGLDGGNGGTVLAQSGGDLTVNTANVNMEARGEDGRGGNIRMLAGFSGDPDFGSFRKHNGALTINGGINVSGKGVGDGGSIRAAAYSIGPEDGDGGGGGVGTAAAALTSVALQGSIQVNNNLTANAGKVGVGGFIELEATASRSASGKVPDLAASVLVGSADAPVNLRADGGTESGDGGFIEVRSNGTVVLNSNVVSASARGDGSGGTINVRVNPAPLPNDDDGGGVISGALIASFALNENPDPTAAANAAFRANGAGTGNGGFVQIRAQSGAVKIDSKNTVAIQTNSGSIEGAGGTIELSADTDLSFNGALHSKGAIAGGSINIESGGSLSGSGASLDVSATKEGTGGAISIESGSEGLGNIALLADLRADGAGSGAGGAVYLKASNDIQLGESSEKVQVLARGGVEGGDGGQLDVKAANLEAHTTAISVAARGKQGNGGNATINVSGLSATLASGISADAGGDGNGGNITINVPNGGLTVNGDLDVHVAQNGTGGTISIDPDLESFINGNFLAQVDGNGDAGEAHWFGNGTFHIFNIILRGSGTGKGGSLHLESALGSIFTSNIVSGSAQGDSGDVVIHAPQGSIHVKSINTSSPLNNAGFVDLFAGKNISAVSINTNASEGIAGAVLLRSNQAGGNDPFVIGGTGQLNGIGAIRVQGAQTSKNPGSDTIESFVAVIDGGSGGISLLNGSALKLSASDDNAPHLLMDSQGKITLPASLVVTTSGQHVGAELYVQAPIISVSGDDLVISANGGSFGGNLALATNSLQSTGNVRLEANGGDNGGTVSLVTHGAISYSFDKISPLRTILHTDIDHDFGITSEVAFQGAAFTLSANGTNSGGNIFVSAHSVKLEGPTGAAQAAGSIRLDANSIVSGNGGLASIAASTLQLAHNSLLVRANGAGLGSGGNISISIFDQGPAVGSGQREISLSANGGMADESHGSAGSITINHTSTNDFILHGSGISLTPGLNGSGGELEVIGNNGSVRMDGVFNASGRGTGRGGQISVSAQTIVFGNGTIIRADGGANENVAGVIRLNHFSTSTLNLNNAHLYARGEVGVVFVKSNGQIMQQAEGLINVSGGDKQAGSIVFSSRFDSESTPSSLSAELNGTLNASSNLFNGIISFDAPAADVGLPAAP